MLPGILDSHLTSGPWSDLPLSFHAFLEVAGGERSVSLGWGSVSLSAWTSRSSFTASVTADGGFHLECLVHAEVLEEVRLGGVLRFRGVVGEDPLLEAAADWIREAALRRDPGPARDLGGMVHSLLPRLQARAHGFRLTPRTRPGEGVRLLGSLTYLWWTPKGPEPSYQECRLTGKVGMSRGERSVRAGMQLRARSQAPREGSGSLRQSFRDGNEGRVDPTLLGVLAGPPERGNRAPWLQPIHLLEAGMRRPWERVWPGF